LRSAAEKLGSAAIELIRPRRLSPRERTLPKTLEEDIASIEEAREALLDQLSGSDHEELRPIIKGLRITPEDGSDPVFRRDLFIALFERTVEAAFPYHLGGMSQRALALTDYLVGYASPFAAEYLRRVAECYIRGMFTEFAVMCRAVLDVSLKDVLDDGAVEERIGDRRRVTLADRITAAVDLGMFRAEDGEHEAADRIRVTGNAAAHGDPILESVPDVLLGDLTKALNAVGRYQQG